MTLWEVEDLYGYWRRNPPLRDLVAAIAQTLGIELPSSDHPEYMTAEAFKAFVDATGGRIPGVPRL